MFKVTNFKVSTVEAVVKLQLHGVDAALAESGPDQSCSFVE